MQLVDPATFETPFPTSARRAGIGPAPLRPRRGPRAEEIALMRTLAAGPRAVTEGPIGRCVKRDWCRAVVVDSGEGPGRTSAVLFALTEIGRALIA
ncbi:hypothetical protein D3273_07930 [Lichenibacterium minor]|jgi:hypothetical protein|uniref:Uncharacterized protein n=1 Tax=Lichenibacterium minor TaxID=2316528 RepID=A0A4Q2UCS3_9HYPH|nr:hypothetical protein [Lichenibacterium minor]RYC32645.1 hypothetical protein D3273_07930 [Lichenibacterium minor]